MFKGPISRRTWLQSGVAGSYGVLAGIGAVASAESFAAAPATKPSALTITNVETFSLAHKLPKAIGVSTALSNVRDALLVKITTDSGLVGWGETSDVGGTRGIIEDHLKTVLLGKNPLEHRKLWRALWGANFGDGRAVAGVDIALHDLRGKALGQSVAEMYGGRQQDKIMAYAAAMNYTEGVRPEDQYPAEAAALVKRGFLAMKIRTGRFENRRDLAVLAKVRETVGAEIRLLTDGNGAFTLPQAVKFGKELDKLDFYCFEEPLPQGLNYAGYDVLTQSLDIAVAGGEALDSRSSARDHVVKRSFDIIQPDVTLCGGVAEVLFIAEMARIFSVQCIPHCWSGAIAIAATLQVLSLLPPYTWGFTSDQPMLEFDVFENPFRDEIVANPFQIKNGHVSVPTGPGLGIEVIEERVKKYVAK
ncbi:MAG TPA: mandelate racemase/muconate lactonizing enzyme family protein [Planctomycetaceae bacterium]|nr:mandelate racemase/muconate lactonizing enzyme family protein [Planctomycetaceae bacterium]